MIYVYDVPNKMKINGDVSGRRTFQMHRLIAEEFSLFQNPFCGPAANDVLFHDFSRIIDLVFDLCLGTSTIDTT